MANDAAKNKTTDEATGEGTPADVTAAAPTNPLDSPDLSNTYENGVPGANIDTAVPKGAHIVTDPNEAQDKGYFGYARGDNMTESYTLPEAGKRNKRLREARINGSAASEEKGGKKS